ncbi:hypothetical protein K501DRAFT_275980 [Backusella circina FSU 941]|nr:hypothetical protein K501DRAFT_275980 [Backusella circina FSU 941]
MHAINYIKWYYMYVLLFECTSSPFTNSRKALYINYLILCSHLKETKEKKQETADECSFTVTMNHCGHRCPLQVDPRILLVNILSYFTGTGLIVSTICCFCGGSDKNDNEDFVNFRKSVEMDILKRNIGGETTKITSLVYPQEAALNCHKVQSDI